MRSAKTAESASFRQHITANGHMPKKAVPQSGNGLIQQNYAPISACLMRAGVLCLLEPYACWIGVAAGLGGAAGAGAAACGLGLF